MGYFKLKNIFLCFVFYLAFSSIYFTDIISQTKKNEVGDKNGDSYYTLEKKLVFDKNDTPENTNGKLSPDMDPSSLKSGAIKTASTYLYKIIAYISLIVIVGSLYFLFVKKRDKKSKKSNIEIIDSLNLTPSTRLFVVRIGDCIVKLTVGKENVVNLGSNTSGVDNSGQAQNAKSFEETIKKELTEVNNSNTTKYTLLKNEIANLKYSLDNWKKQM